MANSTIKNTKVKSSEMAWGTGITFTLPDVANQALVIINNTLWVVWLAGNTDIDVRGIAGNNQIVESSATGQVTVDGNTFKRNGKNVTITNRAYSAFRAFY